MGKTTIDGLAVRSSSSSKRAVSHTQKPHRSTRPRPQANQSHKRSSQPNSSKQTEPLILNSTTIEQEVRPVRRTSIDGVSQPAAYYDYTEEIDEVADMSELDADDPDNWSDLLDGFSEAKPTSSTSSDFLEKDNSGFFGDLSDEDIPEKPRKKRQKSARAPKKKKSKKVRRIVIGTIFTAVVAAVAVAVIWGDQIISKLTNGNSGIWDTVWSLVSDEVPFEEDASGRTNVLVFGTEGYDMNGSTGNGSVHAGAQLTDSIMAISFDQETKDIAMISIPRDLKVPMACSAGKINEVYSCHNQNGTNEQAGAEALAKQVGEVLGLDFQYWAHVNWGSLENIVDLLGGITVTLDEDVNDYYYTTMVVPAGVPTHLTGVQAVALARARHGTAGGDFSRGHTQQKILEGIIQKVVENGIGFTDAINLLNILGDNFRSNFSSENIKSGVALASGFSTDNIRQVPLIDYNNNIYYMKTATINDISYVIPSAGANNYTDIHEYLKQMLSSNQAVREGALLAVYNASWTNGAAEAERSGLESEGFRVSNTGEVNEYDCTDTYCVYMINNEMPATAEILRNKYQVDLRPAEELPNDIRANNNDFIIVVGNTTGKEE